MTTKPPAPTPPGVGPFVASANPTDIPDRFNLFFKADGTQIPCYVIWRKDERIGVAFD